MLVQYILTLNFQLETGTKVSLRTTDYNYITITNTERFTTGERGVNPTGVNISMTTTLALLHVVFIWLL